MHIRGTFRQTVCWALVLIPGMAFAQAATETDVDVQVRIQLPSSPVKEHTPAAVVWLAPASISSAMHVPAPGHYTLLQKNRMFSPHLLVIPVGSVVSFPNADPFFHNVFSYFNGKRFDLGLYEAGASKDVVFSREGVSYIFCNIHPQMSAVILTLDTPLYGIADSSAKAVIRNVPPGDYLLHIWVEGLTQPSLDRMTRHVQVGGGASNVVTLDARSAPHQPDQHLNKFGEPYDRQPSSPY
jgi:plastocyanin